MRKSITFRPNLDDTLEDRAVPSGFAGMGMISPIQTQPIQVGQSMMGGGGSGGGMGGGMGVSMNQPGQHPGTVGMTASPLLTQDSQLTQQAFQTLGASMTSALANLRQTATTTAPPTAAGMKAYKAAVDTAIGKMNTTLAADLKNLPSTGTTLARTIMGQTATLQTELENAGSVLTRSTSAAMLAAQQKVNGYTQSAMSQMMTAIMNDHTMGMVTSPELQAYNQAELAALQTFDTAINSAAQSAISGGTALDSTAVGSAVSAYQASLDTAISNLGLSSASDPTAAVDASLASLQTQLLAIPAPAAGSQTAALQFVRSINMAIGLNTMQISQTVQTAVANDNNSLLGSQPMMGGGMGISMGQPGQHPGTVGMTTSPLLTQDSQLTQQAFQTLGASMTSALANLRQTATTTAPPTAAGMKAYKAAVDTAIGKMNTTLTADLKNLPSTGTTLARTIMGQTATLQTELENAGSVLTRSTSAAMLAAQQKVNGYSQSAMSQAMTAIMNDHVMGMVTLPTLQAYNQAELAALQSFDTAINSAAQSAISSGTALDSTAVGSAVSAYQTSLNTAISNLGLSSASDPTAAVDASLASLQTQLLALPAPTAGNQTAALQFVRSINMTIGLNTMQISQTVQTAAANDNNSLL